MDGPGVALSNGRRSLPPLGGLHPRSGKHAALRVPARRVSHHVAHIVQPHGGEGGERVAVDVVVRAVVRLVHVAAMVARRATPRVEAVGRQLSRAASGRRDAA